MNRLERSNQGPPRKTTIVKLVRALGWSLVDERSQRLMAAAGYGAFPEDDEGRGLCFTHLRSLAEPASPPDRCVARIEHDLVTHR